MMFRQMTKTIKWVVRLLAAAGVLQSFAAQAQSWPGTYEAPTATCKEGSYADGLAYQSRSYVILSSERLAAGRVNEMATVAESVRGALARFPLDLLPDRQPTLRERHRDVIRIFPTQKSYLQAGGPVGSSGYYNARSKEVMVSKEFLIEPKGNGSNLEPRQRYRLLVHELVHQAMAENAVLLPLWLSEGIAEYLSAAQFAPGRYRFNANQRDIVNHLRAVWLHDRRNTMTIPTVASLVQLDSRAWSIDNRTNKGNAYAKYAASLLLTHYFLELAARDLGGLRDFLIESKATISSTRSGRSRRNRGRPALDQSPLWKDRPTALIQQQLTIFWSSKGLKLTFTPHRPPD
ncbi:MAG: hypothetical protein ACI9R3_000437 [Verrucomicrobiales bacterium]|jgi:hypothetical protein